MKSLLNKRAVRERILDVAEVRGTKFTRVSADFITNLEEKVKDLIRDSVKNHPSFGKTIIQHWW